jgi:hypothetical protein
MDRDELSPAEAARERRRDRDAEARARAGMKTGLAKQFKPIRDAQVKRAKAAEDRRPTAETKAPSEHRSKRNPRTDG